MNRADRCGSAAFFLIYHVISHKRKITQQQQILFWQNERNCLTIKTKANICVIFENYFKITLSTETNQKNTNAKIRIK